MDGLLKEQLPQEENAPTEAIPEQEQEFSSPEVKGLYDQAVVILYDKKYKQLVDMFKANGEQGFPRSISTSINTVLGELEKQAPITPEVAAEVGIRLFYDLLEDVVEGELLPKLSMETIQEGLNQTMTMYAQSHQDTVSNDDMANLAGELEKYNQVDQGGENGIT